MTTRGVSVLAVGLVAFLVLGGGASAVGAPPGQPEALAQGPIQAAFLQAPLSFEVNRGQTAAQVKYLSRGPGRTLFLTPSEAVLVLQRDQQTRRDPRTQHAGTVLRLRLVGANLAPRVEGLDPLPGKANYFIGNDPTKWRANVPTYAKVKYQAVYPGVDLVYYGTNQRQLEYDFVVAPGAKPKAIRLAFSGVDRLSLDAHGDLILHMAGGKVVQHAPKVYQEIDGARQAVVAGYVLHGKDQVGFRVARYDVTRPLVIDPVLDYATYLGGSGSDQGNGIAVDAAGTYVYVTGTTASSTFPISPAGTGGAYQQTFSNGVRDAFVAKLDPTQIGAASLVYSTYLGGSGSDRGAGIAVDSFGNAYVVGSTQSVNFPTTTGAFQTTFGGNIDAFVALLNPIGSMLLYSTYLGGSGQDEGTAIAVDGSGKAYVTGRTRSSSIGSPPATTLVLGNGVPGGTLDAFVAKLDPSLVAGTPSLIYFTYLSGSGSDQGLGVAVDSSGNAYVTGDTNSPSSDFSSSATIQALLGPGGGTDAFVAKLGSAGNTLDYFAVLGGDGSDTGKGIVVDAAGKAYVTGSTDSTNFLMTVPPLPTAFQPTFGGTLDAFVAKLDPTLSGIPSLVYSTYLGGSGFDSGFGIAVDATGNAYVTGSTDSIDFPPLNPLSPSGGVNAGGSDAFVTKLNPTGTALVYSTYLGGSGSDQGAGIAVDATGNAYVTGQTFSSNFPMTTPLNAFQPTFGGGGDAFVAKLGLGVVSATFSVTVTPAGTGTGTVTSSPAGISCPGTTTCTATFASGATVTLTAAPTGGSTFSWSGDCAGTALTCTLTMNAAKSVTATFSSGGGSSGGGTFFVTVTVAGSGTGTVTSSPAGINCPGICSTAVASGTGVTLTATPTGGATLSWGGACAGTVLTCALTADADKLVTATFSVVGGDGASSCNMVGHVHGNQNYKATISGKKVNVHVEVDGDCDYDKKANKVFLHHAMVHVVVGGGPPLINAKQNSNGKRDDVKSVTLSPGPPPATGTPTAIVEGIYNAIPFKVTLTDGGKRDKDDDHDKCGKGGDDKWSKDDGGKRDKDDDHDKCGKGGDDGKGNKDDTIVVVTPVLPAPITGSAPHDDVHIDFK